MLLLIVPGVVHAAFLRLALGLVLVLKQEVSPFRVASLLLDGRAGFC